jgi:Skp family chaperone for outer membrane proteins
MLKKIIIFIVFFNSFLNISLSDDNVVYVDIDYVINNSLPGKIIINRLDKINKINISKIKVQEDEIKKQDEEISKIKNIISKKDLQIKINELKNSVNLFRQNQKKINDDFLKLKNKELNDFMAKLSPIIKQYLNDNKIGIVIDKKNIVIANPKYDITEQIILLINKEFK